MIAEPVTHPGRHRAGERIARLVQCETEKNIAHYASAGREEIHQRLSELDKEWDLEKTFEADVAIASLAGFALALLSGRRWLLLPLLGAGFLLQHAYQGWSWPLTLLRRMGLRTRAEIDQERYALKTFRGDLQNLRATEGAYRGTVAVGSQGE